MKKHLFKIYFKLLNGRNKRLQNIYHYFPSDRDYPLDGDLMRALIGIAACNRVSFAALVGSFPRRTLALKPADVATALDENLLCNHSIQPTTFWEMSAADLNAFFGLFVDYSSALPYLVEHETTIKDIDANLWAIVLAAAYSKFPQIVDAEYVRAKEHHANLVRATGDEREREARNLRIDLFQFARGLITSYWYEFGKAFNA